MFKKALLLLSSVSVLLVMSCNKEDGEAEDQTPTETPNNNYTGVFTIDGATVSFTDGGNASMIPGAAFLQKSQWLDTVVVGVDTTVNKYTAIASRHTMTYSSKTSLQKLTISTDSVRYVTGPDTSVMMTNMDTINTGPYWETSNHTINRAPEWAFYDIFARNAPGLASSGSNGFIVTYIDKSGAVWKSNLGAQSNSSLSVSVSEKGKFSDGLEYVKGNVKFTCTVYNGAASKVITGGSVNGLFINSK